MIHFSRFSKLFRWPAIPFVAIGLMTASTVPLIATTAQAQIGDADYGECAADLLAAGVDVDDATIACSLAFEPTEVSGCVTDVLAVSDVAPKQALSACSRDRRPDEVASCVFDIHQDLVVDNSLSVLNYCHRSILPKRYAACVIGIVSEADYTTDESLERCIAAGYRPENIAPTYIPTE